MDYIVIVWSAHWELWLVLSGHLHPVRGPVMQQTTLRITFHRPYRSKDISVQWMRFHLLHLLPVWESVQMLRMIVLLLRSWAMRIEVAEGGSMLCCWWWWWCWWWFQQKCPCLQQMIVIIEWNCITVVLVVVCKDQECPWNYRCSEWVTSED